jgi:CheY-like chemotaxis protein
MRKKRERDTNRRTNIGRGMKERSEESTSNPRMGPRTDKMGRTKPPEKPSKLWLLLVEDDPGDQMLVREILKSTKLDAKLTLVKDGEKAISCVEKWSGSNRPDLVLLDLNLPKRDARDVLDHIRMKDPTVRVVALTGFDLQSDIAQEWESRVDGYLVKPIGLDELDRTAERLRELMRSPSH